MLPENMLASYPIDGLVNHRTHGLNKSQFLLFSTRPHQIVIHKNAVCKKFFFRLKRLHQASHFSMFRPLVLWDWFHITTWFVIRRSILNKSFYDESNDEFFQYGITRVEGNLTSQLKKYWTKSKLYVGFNAVACAPELLWPLCIVTTSEDCFSFNRDSISKLSLKVIFCFNEGAKLI